VNLQMRGKRPVAPVHVCHVSSLYSGSGQSKDARPDDHGKAITLFPSESRVEAPQIGQIRMHMQKIFHL
ncbi:MAG: hypothetical protein KGI94_07665, partial [Paracoccaceae bacterium]|nr:hypothetical protein [Paracoccaceae bacterium]